MQADTPVFIETMRVENGRVPLLEVHADRLLWGLYQCDISVDVLQTRKLFMEAVMVQAADLPGLHRLRCEVRIQAGRPFFSFSSSIFHSSCSRLTIGAYVDSRKPASFPWNAKTTDREIYKAALKWAISKGWEDAVVFSEEGLVADACIYSVFVWKDGILFTPPAADMPVRSVFKEWLMRNTVFPIIERSLSAQDLRDADLIILSNAVRMMQIGVWIDAIEA
jgi:branched-subunit amino acid aminotransferase/4-amino-4-deoxychorismate lyase